MKQFYLLTVLILAATLPLAAEEFAWSWEGDAAKAKPATAEKPAAPAAADKTSTVTDVKEPFDWAAEKDAPPAGRAPAAPAQPMPAAAPDEPTAPAGHGSIDASAYNELLKENLALRRQMAQATGSQDTVRQENERLGRMVKDLESRIAQFTARIDELNKEKAAKPASPDRVVELEGQLAAAEREKLKLASDLASLKSPAVSPTPAPAATAGVQPGSDLYRQIEKENADLKEKLAQIDADKQRLARESQQAAAAGAQSSQEQEDLKKRLEQAQAEQQKDKATLDKVMRDLPALEKDREKMQSELRKKDSDLDVREKELDQMKAELDAREQRLRKAVRMLAAIAKARVEVLAAGETEKRDLHYNMGLVFARDGRHKDAETEYLRALRIDPNDANSHYNLAVLYDDVMKDNRRAILHYRKYLSLNPHAEDADQVRLWVFQAETKRVP